jgi:ketosteroid isomerase-like protein
VLGLPPRLSEPAHIEAFLRGVDAINRLDTTAVLALTHEECVFEPLRSQTEGAFVGHDGMRRFLADTAETFDLFKASYADLRDLGDERLLAIGTIRMRGRESGAETDVVSAAIVEFRDGRMWRYHDDGNVRLALRTAGISG